MRIRWLGVALALAMVGGAIGYAVGERSRVEPTTFAARPVPASSPSIPVDPVRPYAEDIDYPALQADLAYRPHTIGSPGFDWTYVAPRGWSMTQAGATEFNWRPVGEPTRGGYALRVELVSGERKTTRALVEQKQSDVLALYDDVEVSVSTDDELRFTYREPSAQTKRYDLFKWFAPPGVDEAGFEMSIVGRQVDEPGLVDLLDNVAASVRKIP